VGRPPWREDGSIIYSYNSLSGPSPPELMTTFYCFVWDTPNLEGQVPVFISPRNRVPQLFPPATAFPFCRLLRLAGLQWRYSNPPPHGPPKLKLKLNYFWQSVGQSILVSSSRLEPMTRILFSVWQLQVSCCGAPSLTREWVCNLFVHCFWALQEQSLWGASPAELGPYLSVSFETSQTWRARSPYLYSPGPRWPRHTPRHWAPFSSSLTTRRATVTPPLHESPSLRVEYFTGHWPHRKQRVQQLFYCRWYLLPR
jgi:hypothetical protein